MNKRQNLAWKGSYLESVFAIPCNVFSLGSNAWFCNCWAHFFRISLLWTTFDSWFFWFFIPSLASSHQWQMFLSFEGRLLIFLEMAKCCFKSSLMNKAKDWFLVKQGNKPGWFILLDVASKMAWDAIVSNCQISNIKLSKWSSLKHTCLDFRSTQVYWGKSYFGVTLPLIMKTKFHSPFTSLPYSLLKVTWVWFRYFMCFCWSSLNLVGETQGCPVQLLLTT